MSNPRLRPKCRIVSQQSPGEVLEKLADSLQKETNKFEGQVVQEHAFIRIPEKDQHYWSPELHVWARQEDEGTIVYGVMGPKPKIWTMFIFFYTGVITSAFFGSSYGVIQLLLGMDAPFLWSIPLGILGIALVYGAAQYGQYRGKEQMEQLKAFLEGNVV
ncbi:MAG: hypothetical protein K9H58_14785 [Bacteroidales bacterium]|nr:hypothetical protein [Bacteroidales bacterium]